MKKSVQVTTGTTMLDIGETAKLMTQLGYPIAVSTLRDWRKGWLRGNRKGPAPLLLHPRCMRYERDDVVEVTKGLIEAARRATTGE